MAIPFHPSANLAKPKQRKSFHSAPGLPTPPKPRGKGLLDTTPAALQTPTAQVNNLLGSGTAMAQPKPSGPRLLASGPNLSLGRQPQLTPQQQSALADLDNPAAGDHHAKPLLPRPKPLFPTAIGAPQPLLPQANQPGQVVQMGSPPPRSLTDIIREQNQRVTDAHPSGFLPNDSYINNLSGGDRQVISGPDYPVGTNAEADQLLASRAGSAYQSVKDDPRFQAYLARINPGRARSLFDPPEQAPPQGQGLLANVGMPPQQQPRTMGLLPETRTPQQQAVIANAQEKADARRTRLFGPSMEAQFAMRNPEVFGDMQRARLMADAQAAQGAGLVDQRAAQADLFRAQAERERAEAGRDPNRDFRDKSLLAVAINPDADPDFRNWAIEQLQGRFAPEEQEGGGLLAGEPSSPTFSTAETKSLEGLQGYSSEIVRFAKERNWPDWKIDKALAEYGGSRDRTWGQWAHDVFTPSGIASRGVRGYDPGLDDQRAGL